MDSRQEKYESDEPAEDFDDEKKLRSAERREVFQLMENIKLR